MANTLPSRYRLLCVEEDADLRSRVGTYLEDYSCEITPVGSIAEARILLQSHRFDLMLLNLAQPDGDGWELLSEVTHRGRPPVIATSSRAEETDRILAIEAGADDYLVKPYSFRELVARVRSVARRTSGDKVARVRRLAHFDKWTLDLAARRAESGERVVELTAGELAILRVLMERPHHVLSRSELLASTRHDDAEVFDRTVDVLISRLRRKLEIDPLQPAVIQTVRGEGYYFTRSVVWQTEP